MCLRCNIILQLSQLVYIFFSVQGDLPNFLHVYDIRSREPRIDTGKDFCFDVAVFRNALALRSTAPHRGFSDWGSAGISTLIGCGTRITNTHPPHHWWFCFNPYHIFFLYLFFPSSHLARMLASALDGFRRFVTATCVRSCETDKDDFFL